MPTACSPRNYASCTSMIGGRLRSVQIPAEGSGSHPFATCVCPIPVSVFRFPFFFLYGPSSFHQRSCHISPFSPLHFLCSVMLSSISALPASSVCPPPPLLVTFSLCSLIFPHYNVRARVWVWKCCKFCKFASLPSVFFFFRFCLRACEYYNVSVFFLPCPPL